MNSTKKHKRNHMFLHEIGKKLIQITLYLSNYENRLYFLYFVKYSSIYRSITHILSRIGCYLLTLHSICT
ncbi:hypothetical protein COD78_30060 [Bacillus cereus]|nr:hypothetical protein CN454_26000 [Bacillus cereus]PGV17771.1 hypothetical protein COD78_30060 [Bacillus cereus]